MDRSFLIVGCSGSSAGGLAEVVMAQHFIFLKETRSFAEEKQRRLEE